MKSVKMMMSGNQSSQSQVHMTVFQGTKSVEIDDPVPIPAGGPGSHPTPVT
jgi:hypothetical protein